MSHFPWGLLLVLVQVKTHHLWRYHSPVGHKIGFRNWLFSLLVFNATLTLNKAWLEIEGLCYCPQYVPFARRVFPPKRWTKHSPVPCRSSRAGWKADLHITFLLPHQVCEKPILYSQVFMEEISQRTEKQQRGKLISRGKEMIREVKEDHKICETVTAVLRELTRTQCAWSWSEGRSLEKSLESESRNSSLFCWHCFSKVEIGSGLQV